jgi:hypothetical protein
MDSVQEDVISVKNIISLFTYSRRERFSALPDRLDERVDVVATLEERHDSHLAVLLRGRLHSHRHPPEVRRREDRAAQRIVLPGVQANS